MKNTNPVEMVSQSDSNVYPFQSLSQVPCDGIGASNVDNQHNAIRVVKYGPVGLDFEPLPQKSCLQNGAYMHSYI